MLKMMTIFISIMINHHLRVAKGETVKKFDSVLTLDGTGNYTRIKDAVMTASNQS